MAYFKQYFQEKEFYLKTASLYVAQAVLGPELRAL
jgi:hypothetical protein